MNRAGIPVRKGGEDVTDNPTWLSEKALLVLAEAERLIREIRRPAA